MSKRPIPEHVAARWEGALVAYAEELGIPTEDRLRLADRMELFWRLERLHIPRRLAVWLAQKV